jgi:DNA repair exonuclease SbcCD nuclease subunit
MTKNIIGVLGDLHFKDNLSYADYIEDRRVGEKKEILDFIVNKFSDCGHIVFMGDNFNSKNNSSSTNRAFVEFLERFSDKQIYIIGGNHEKKGDGTTAIDFLAEVKKDNWHIYTKLPPRQGTVDVGGLKVRFLPYILNSELGCENSKASTKKIMANLDGGDILFAHHCISGTFFNGVKTEDLSEVVLPQKELEEKYGLIVAGHIHKAQDYGKVIITGNVFTTEVGDKEKFIFKINSDLQVEKIKVPAREIHKIENPTTEQLSSIPKDAIVKVIITNKTIDPEEMKQKLSRFDASLLIEDYPNERKKMHIEEGAIDFSIEALLEMYAKDRGVDYQKLLKGLSIING